MAFKAVSVCALVFVALQCVAARPSCYRPLPPSCGCSSGKVIIEEIEEISYQPTSIRAQVPSVCFDVPNNGGALVITSIGSIVPSGIAVATDLGLGGDLFVSGELPYLSAVAFEGQFASGGEVPVSYGCGDIVAITEQIGGSAAPAPLSYNLPSINSYSLPSPYSIPSCSCSLPPVKSCGCKY